MINIVVVGFAVAVVFVNRSALPTRLHAILIVVVLFVIGSVHARTMVFIV